MPLPLLLIGAAALASGYGVKKGYDGYQKHSEADEIVKAAERRYKSKRKELDVQEKTTTSVLEALGTRELKIGQRFEEFRTIADALLKQLNAGRQDKLEISLPKHKLQDIEHYSYTALGVLGTAAGAGFAGAAAGFAVYGGVMALGAASTGTAISSLSGVAATNAALAAIGGGSIATGGLGMAGGTAILGASVAAPVLLIAGWAYDRHGEEALDNAKRARRECDDAIAKMDRAQTHLGRVEKYAVEIYQVIQTVCNQFDQYFDELKRVNRLIEDAQNPKAELNKLTDEVMRLISNGFALAAILVDLITTPVFKVKEVNGKIVKDGKGVPVMETDADGSMILNHIKLDQQINQAKTNAYRIEPV